MPGPVKTRRRGEELETAILEAAWAELHEVGYNALTMEAVAARAGTSKPVIYRRWSSRAELVLAAWARRQPRRPIVPDSGSLRQDLLALFTRVARRADRIMSEMVAGVLGEAFRHPEVTALLREQLRTSPLTDTIRAVVRNATARGELPEVEISRRVAMVPLDLIRNETITWGGPLSRETIEELVDEVYLPLLRGLAPKSPPGP
ncbi:TetR/AcrR family transcriptional regulator [Amycolatopsis acidicola]|uniref:TetR/AcrR family transcriptional regulator n=1 Tax=Amycolatopsis acidicola TaxID=2596893 RepID=A0A5N0UNQ7_9PSEU|nr:TetR/AcrR family transcriptional regulator [Amycolatopsis acidicola]KAA9151063.1 TetR/AcrR family transcriptional regulator [Amycolatopsis acidicola]